MISASENASFFSCMHKGQLGSSTGNLSVQRRHACPSSSGERLSAFCRPRRHEERHGVSATADTSKVIGIVDHQFDRLVPQVVAHPTTSKMRVTRKIRGGNTCSGCQTKGRGVQP